MNVNIGVIGLGRIGKLHAEHLALRIPEANLVSIAEIKEQIDAAKIFAERLGVTKVVEDHNELLNDKDVDAIVVCSPANTHFQIISEAAKAGKHIFCEKPIDHDLSKVDKALRAIKRAGVKFQVGFNRRFDPNFAQVRQAILEGKVGKPYFIHIVSRDPAPPPLEYIKTSGGIFVDMTTHDFDMARFLIGSEVEEVFACGEAMIDPSIAKAGDIDTALTVLKFKNGTIGTIDNCRKASYGYDQRVEVFGSLGSIATENQTSHRTVVSNSDGVHTPTPLHFFLERYTESYIREMRAFIDAIINDAPTPVSGIDGRIPIVMAMAAKKSYLEKRIVKLKEIR